MERDPTEVRESGVTGEPGGARDALDAAEARALLAAADSLRDRALLTLGLGSGLRLRELCALRMEDLRPLADGAALVEIRGSQSRPRRRVEIGSATFAPVRDYVEHTGRSWDRASDLETPLFIGWGRRARLTRCRAYQIVAQALAGAGIRGPAHPLLLRRTFHRLRVGF